VVPACNEAAYIAGAVNSILTAFAEAETSAALELVVVDDDSSDTTAQIAQRHGAAVLHVRQRNIAAVRNTGAAATTGELLVFVDADTRLSASLVRETLQSALDGMVWGTALARPWDNGPWWVRVVLPLFNWYYVRWRRYAYGFYFVVTRNAFEDAGRFPVETLEGEDMALSKQLLARHGPPTVFRSPVETSARKADAFGFLYHVKMLWLTIRYGDAIYAHPSIADFRDGEQRVGRGT
jgi:glycosyltransferase involved in cell wall biosynthesis